jgi:glycosyltransferase involved in cell wall biosynthesis
MKISVITPSFNQGEFIERTIQSVLSQTLGQHELDYVVMDGASTDQTVAILKRYENRLSFRSEPDHGQTHAVNKGLHATSGDIIGWLNSDDVYYPGAIKRICDYFAEHPDVDVIYGDAHFIDRHDQVMRDYPTEKWDIERLKSRCYISQPATFFRRRVLLQHGYLDERLHFCMDYEFWLRLGLQGVKFVYLPGVLAGSRMYAETKTSSGYLKANLEAIEMLKRHLQVIPAEWVVSNCGVQVKAKYGVSYPQLRFIFLVWMNLWRATGQYYQGLSRFKIWLASQQAMLKKFLRRACGLAL